MLAAVDMGTNSFHMVIVRADAKGRFQIVDVVSTKGIPTELTEMDVLRAFYKYIQMCCRQSGSKCPELLLTRNSVRAPTSAEASS